MFAALNTVEPPIVEREAFMLMEHDKEWLHKRRPLLDDNVRKRLGELTNFLQNADWLDGEFSVADLLMVSVLRRLDASNIPSCRLSSTSFRACRHMCHGRRRVRRIGAPSTRSSGCS